MYLPTSKDGISKELGLFLMEQRLRQRLTINQMSQKLGIRPVKLSKMETGTYCFALDEVALLSTKLNVEIVFSPRTSKSKSKEYKSECRPKNDYEDFFNEPVSVEE